MHLPGRGFIERVSARSKSPIVAGSDEKNPIEWLHRHPIRLVCIWRIDTAVGYCPMHTHPSVELVYHCHGSGVTTLETGQQIRFEPHGTVIYPARLRHDQRTETWGDDICLHIDWPKSAPSAQSWIPEPLYVPPLPVDPFVRGEFLQLAQTGFDPARRVELNLRATALLARLLNLSRPFADEAAPDPVNVYLTRARQYIHENHFRIQSVREIASHVGVSEDYLRHLFAERDGTSLSRLVTEARIERAKELLIHSRLPLKEIAALCGFQTERYLSARFKSFTGHTPGTFRRNSLQRTADRHPDSHGQV